MESANCLTVLPPLSSNTPLLVVKAMSSRSAAIGTRAYTRTLADKGAVDFADNSTKSSSAAILFGSSNVLLHAKQHARKKRKGNLSINACVTNCFKEVIRAGLISFECWF